MRRLPNQNFYLTMFHTKVIMEDSLKQIPLFVSLMKSNTISSWPLILRVSLSMPMPTRLIHQNPSQTSVVLRYIVNRLLAWESQMLWMGTLGWRCMFFVLHSKIEVFQVIACRWGERKVRTLSQRFALEWRILNFEFWLSPYGRSTRGRNS